MAKSTCNPNADIPKGMMKFETIRSGIKDSLGQYCLPGDMAVMDKKLAQHYLDLNFIKVALPDFDEDDDASGSKDTADEAKRSTPKSDTRSGRGKGSSGPTTDD